MINDKDIKILNHLRNNSRARVTNIAKNLNTPATTIYDRLRSLENKVIKKHTTLIDYSKLGYNQNSFVKIKQNSKELSDYLCNHKNVNSIYKTNYHREIIFQTIFKNHEQFYLFIEELKNRFKFSDIIIDHIDDVLKIESFLQNLEE